MMASLPSVVLGFLAGAVVAPFVEELDRRWWSAASSPFRWRCLAGAYVWQLLPQRLSLLAVRWRLALIFAMLPLGVCWPVAWPRGSSGHWFGGDVRAWLDGQVGTGVGGWTMLLLPLASLLSVGSCRRSSIPRLRRSFITGPAGAGPRSIW